MFFPRTSEVVNHVVLTSHFRGTVSRIRDRNGFGSMDGNAALGRVPDDKVPVVEVCVI